MKSIDNLREWSHRFDYTWIKPDGTMVFTTDTSYECDGENYGRFIRSMIDDIEYEMVAKERTCKNVNAAVYTFTCSECTYELHMPFGWRFRYCPNCGAKVVE